MTLVKICGVSTSAQALAAARAGADLIGLVFYAPSHRAVTVSEATTITASLRDEGHRTLVVGLFVNEPAELVNRVGHKAGLDLVQLSGDEPSDVLPQVDLPLLRTVRIGASDDVDLIRQRVRRDEAAVGGRPPGPLGQPLTLLLDARVAGAWGGTGEHVDWSVARHLAREYPAILAGGLTPENVGEAVATARPFGVDVSSGVETERVKDTDKIRRFIHAVRATAPGSHGSPVAFEAAGARQRR